MRELFVIATALLSVGCSLTPTQKKIVSIGAGVLVVGAIAAHEADKGNHGAELTQPSLPCRYQPDGSCR